VLAYVVRRLAYGALVVIGVMFFLFLLFFALATPDDVARRALGEKAPPRVIEQWKANHGYDRPLWPWGGAGLRGSLLYDHFRRMLTFDFGRSDADDVPIAERLRRGMAPSLALTVPLFVLGLGVGISLSLLVALFRETYIDRLGVFLAVLGMSVSILLYIIGGQYLVGKLLRWFPISGFDPSPELLPRFLALPILVGLLSGLGSDLRFYRTVFVEETGRDYVRTARAKGCGEARVMWRHVLRNALIPILTQVVLAIPFLFTGALLLESFFGIPGLGAITRDAIAANDFSTLRTMVYIGSLLFILGQILTDVSYALADPRVRLE
jgi:peptide/nickel transport system permease protein